MIQNNLVYCGSFTTTQTNGNKKLLNYGAPVYSKKQNELYNRALVGLKAYTPEELYVMNSTKKNKIKRVHKRAQKILNNFKNRRMMALLEKSIDIIIPNLKQNSFLHKLISKPDLTAFNNMKFHQLEIDKEQIIDLWIRNNILPANFFSL